MFSSRYNHSPFPPGVKRQEQATPHARSTTHVRAIAESDPLSSSTKRGCVNKRANTLAGRKLRGGATEAITRRWALFAVHLSNYLCRTQGFTAGETARRVRAGRTLIKRARDSGAVALRLISAVQGPMSSCRVKWRKLTIASSSNDSFTIARHSRPSLRVLVTITLVAESTRWNY